MRHQNMATTCCDRMQLHQSWGCSEYITSSISSSIQKVFPRSHLRKASREPSPLGSKLAPNCATWLEESPRHIQHPTWSNPVKLGRAMGNQHQGFQKEAVPFWVGKPGKLGDWLPVVDYRERFFRMVGSALGFWDPVTTPRFWAVRIPDSVHR